LNDRKVGGVAAVLEVYKLRVSLGCLGCLGCHSGAPFDTGYINTFLHLTFHSIVLLY
jgi:hypothetical protein